MPAWMHERAEHILAKNPSMPKSEAFAIATQQMHSLGKSPKGYGTADGRATAKEKYDTPKDDKKTANPGGLKSEKMEKKSEVTLRATAFLDELSKIASTAEKVKSVGKSALEHGLQGAYGFLRHRIGPAVETGTGVATGDTKAIARGVGGIASGGLLYHAGKREGEHEARKKK